MKTSTVVAAICTGLLASGCAPVPVPEISEVRSCSCSGGELIITEAMINPTGEDDGLEWLEVVNISQAPVQLEGLFLVSGTMARPMVAPVTAYITKTIDPGMRIVLTEAPPAGDPAFVTIDSIHLPNEGGVVAIMCGSVEVATFSWGETPPAPAEGVALQLAPMTDPGMTPIWCESSSPPDEEGNRGTPGLANLPCEGSGECLDPETGRYRRVVRPTLDDLVFLEVFSNPEGSDELTREWVEILSLAEFDLSGLTLTQFNGPGRDYPSRSFGIGNDACNPVKVGDVAVIGPGGIPLTGRETLYNATSGAAMLEITDRAGNVLATGIHPKVPDGKSVHLKTGKDRSKLARDDDDPSNWTVPPCAGGTPGSASAACPGSRKKR